MKDNVLQTALRIAAAAHRNQVDRAGVPYIMHPLAVAAMADTFDEAITALLHDVLEDSAYTPDMLRSAGIPGHIVDALLLLTHDKDTPYMEYVRGIKSNKLAKKVKLADLTHNSDLSRLPQITSKDLDRAEKYRLAIVELASD